VPTEQPVQALADAEAYVPGAQLMQVNEADAAKKGDDVPAAQPTQLALPVLTW
jgi:hypothetical protein